jgi:hypothetical protein
MLVDATFARIRRRKSLVAVLRDILVTPPKGLVPDHAVDTAALLMTAAASVSRLVACRRRSFVDAVIGTRLHGLAHLALSNRLSTAVAGVLSSTNLRATQYTRI